VGGARAVGPTAASGRVRPRVSGPVLDTGDGLL
jgi:hypothetical protein